MSDGPLFSSSREALTFAANFKAAGVEAPVMTRMMREMQKADQEALKVDRRQAVPALQGLSALDRAGQAGIILQMTGRLPDEVLHVLLASVLKPREICNCRAPCCCGWRPNKDWSTSARLVDAMVFEWIKENQRSGKKSAYTLTTKLRMELVQEFFDRQTRRTKAEIAEAHEISEATVNAHQKKIGGHLTGLVRSAFSKLDEILGDAGIVGAVE